MTEPSANAIAEDLLPAVTAEFRRCKELGEKILDQLSDEELLYIPDAVSNSIYIIVKHMAGNMRSRWTDFLTTDGEKPDRNRDEEFVCGRVSGVQIREMWLGGWACLFDALEHLGPADLTRTVQIRNQPHTVVEAILRQLTHYAQHVGQMAYIGKHLKQSGWVSLSIPKAESGPQ